MHNDTIPSKACADCGTEYPYTNEYFPSYKVRGKPYLRNCCTLCWNKRRKAKKDENREADRAARKIWRDNNPDKVKAQKKRDYERNRPRIQAYQHQWGIDNSERLKAESHEYYLEHQNEIIEAAKAYYQEHKEERKAYIKQWQLDNPDKMRLYRKRGYEAHKAEKYLYTVAYRQNNKDKVRAWARDYYALHPDKARAKAHRRRALILASQDGHFTADDVKLQYKSQRGKCWHCGKPVTDSYHVDHLYPLDRGGSNGARNIVVSCPYCNESKGSKPTWEWNMRLL